MSITIAKEEMGFCSCGTRIERGERVDVTNLGTIHVGCPPRQTASVSKVSHTESSGWLFGDAGAAIIEHARKTVGASRISFDGASVLGIDMPRLSGQTARVFQMMSDGKYKTLTQIASGCRCLETSASARLRDLRKKRFGSHTVVSRQVEGHAGLYEYKLIPNDKGKVSEAA